ncbi:FHA domain-containing protein [Nocardia australiensis]|uniref:FHA domain-containing protein n=1 Tax=Nocardia australiensis TaxID=2887191 RepID=UPI001D146BE8|nr:FHA domain-containing protein [Nocardia australiensis]
MRSDPSTVGIAPGNGLIARFGAVVVYLADETSSTDRILGAVEAVADTPHPGAAIALRLATVVFGSGSQPPPFGVIAPTADGTVILLRGAVSAEIDGPEGVRRLAGARAFTWVDEIVREPVRRISVGADSALPLTPHPRADLRAGVVPGGGFVFRVGLRKARKKIESTPGPTAQGGGDKPEPPPTAPAGLAALAESAPDDSDPTGSTVRANSGTGGRSSTAHSSNGGSLNDRGSNSRTSNSPASNNSARNPHAPEDIGTQAVHLAWSQVSDATRPATPSRPEPVALRKVPAPDRIHPRRVCGAQGAPKADTSKAVGSPTGALVLEDGAAFPLDRPYVIGRNPTADDAVRTATASPLAVPRDRHVSRVHAYVSPDRGKVYVRDASTPAGTFIAAPGTDQWTRVGTSPVELPPGWRVRIGRRILTYRTEDRRETPSEISGARGRP